MALTNNTDRPSNDVGFDDHGLDRALAEAITQTSFDPASADVEVKPPDSVESSHLFRWRAHPFGECGAKAVIGVDFSPSRVALIEVCESSNGRQVSGVCVRQVDDPQHDSSLIQILREYGAPSGTPVHVSITSPRAVVRRFTLPKVAKKQREAAASWQARKLIPFALADGESLHGFRFEPDPNSGWTVTLAALPCEDVGQVLESIQHTGWKLQSVTIAGTRKLKAAPATPAADGSTATLLWTPQRSSFVVFRGNDLWFHYDLGIIPPPEDIPGQPATEAGISRWLKTIRKAIGEALEFYGGSNPQDGIEHIQLVGVPEAAAALITDWQELFGSPVVVTPVLESAPQNMPPEVQTWFIRNSAMLVPAFLAVAGSPTIDLTPPEVLQRRQSHTFERITRSVFAVSVLGVVAWSALTLMQKSFAARANADLLEDIGRIEASPINAEIQSCVAGIQQITALNTALENAGTEWMPDVRRSVATLPGHARLRSLSVTPDPATSSSSFLIRLEGVLHPTSVAHSLTYAEWIRALKQIFGENAITLESTHEVHWKESVKSAFVLSIHPGATPAPAGGSRR